MISRQEEIIYDYPYSLRKPIIINERIIKEVSVDSYVKKHEEHGITKELIIDLVKLLKGGCFPPDGSQPKDKRFFKAYLPYGEKNYKLIWWWWLDKRDFILYVRNCHPC